MWDDCLELEALIRSNVAHDIYALNGEVPETIVSRETSGISSFCEYQCYLWMKFCETSVSFPNDAEIIGRYLGPSIDIGPAMTAKILKSNGKVVHCSTFRGLTPDELDDPAMKKEQEEFDENIQKILGPETSKDDFSDLPDIEKPSFDHYDNDDETGTGFIPDSDQFTDENLDQYIGADATPRGLNGYRKGEMQKTGDRWHSQRNCK